MTRTIQTLFYNYWPPEKPLFAAMVLWDKVFKSVLSEFCELGLGLGCLPKNLLNQLLNTLSHTCITEEERKQFYSNVTV